MYFYGYPMVAVLWWDGRLKQAAQLDRFEYSDPSGGTGLTAEEALGAWAIDAPETDTDPLEGNIKYVRKFDEMMGLPSST
jgi:hypothetical protein